MLVEGRERIKREGVTASRGERVGKISKVGEGIATRGVNGVRERDTHTVRGIEPVCTSNRDTFILKGGWMGGRRNQTERKERSNEPRVLRATREYTRRGPKVES